MDRRSDIVESMAIVGTFACLAHCIALPVLIAALPALASVVPVPAAFHLALLVFAVPTTLFALWSGRRRHHRPQALALGLAGLMLLALGVLRFGETPAEVPLTIAGSLTIAAAHVTNWMLRRAAVSGGRRL